MPVRHSAVMLINCFLADDSNLALRPRTVTVDVLLCGTVSASHYHRAMCRWQCAVEPWNYQVKLQLEALYTKLTTQEGLEDPTTR